jgi:hypothetical protein
VSARTITTTKQNLDPRCTYVQTLVKSNLTKITFFSCESVINPILAAFRSTGVKTDVTFSEVAKMVGIAEVNNYEIFNGGDGLSGFRGLYPITSLMSHKYFIIYLEQFFRKISATIPNPSYWKVGI